MRKYFETLQVMDIKYLFYLFSNCEIFLEQIQVQLYLRFKASFIFIYILYTVVSDLVQQSTSIFTYIDPFSFATCSVDLLILKLQFWLNFTYAVIVVR